MGLDGYFSICCPCAYLILYMSNEPEFSHTSTAVIFPVIHPTNPSPPSIPY